MKGTKVLLGALAATVLAGAASADLLWDNNMTENGVNGRAVSPPTFPDIRVADDFQNGETWIIQDFHWLAVEDATWTHGGNAVITIYRDNGGLPGAIFQEINSGYTREDGGRQVFSRQVYSYWAEFDNVELPAGRWHIGVRHPNGGGSGTNYWLTSDGGPDGGAATGSFSLDGGNTWQDEGVNWHHAFEITGIIPAPGALALLGLGGLVGVRRRRR